MKSTDLAREGEEGAKMDFLFSAPSQAPVLGAIHRGGISFSAVGARGEGPAWLAGGKVSGTLRH